MTQLYANNASSKLVAPITNVALTMQIAAGEGARFPNPTGAEFFLVTLFKVVSGIETVNEIVKVTARATDVFTIVRAQEGTTALAFAEDDWVQCRPTAAKATELEAHLADTGNPHVVTKAQVGLGSADDTADTAKPVSVPQQAALDLKADTTAVALKYDKTGGSISGNLTVANGTDSRTILQVSGVSQAQLQATASAVRLASNNTIPLCISTNGVDRMTVDQNGVMTFGGSSASASYSFKGTNTGDLVVFESTDASATAAPDVVLYRNSASPAAADQIGNLFFRGKDSGGNDTNYARILATIIAATDTAELGDLRFGVYTSTGFLDLMTLAEGGLTLIGGIVGSDAALTRMMLKDCAVVAVDKGNSGTSTQTFDYTAGSKQKVTATGNHTFAFSNWPPTGNEGYMRVDFINYGAYTITPPTVTWTNPDGDETTSLSTHFTALAAAGGRSGFTASGITKAIFWSSDAGSTVYGKFI